MVLRNLFKVDNKGTITISFDIYVVSSLRTYNNLTNLSTIFVVYFSWGGRSQVLYKKAILKNWQKKTLVAEPVFKKVACTLATLFKRESLRHRFVVFSEQPLYRTSLYDSSWLSEAGARRCSVKNLFLKIFTGKQLCQSLFFKRAESFPVDFGKFQEQLFYRTPVPL